MSRTITIRTDEMLRKQLEQRARERGLTLSQEIRRILKEAVEEQPLGSKTKHLRGRLALGQQRDEPWRETLRNRNWRP